MPRSSEATYVVQMNKELTLEGGAAGRAWIDVAEVTVPARARRALVIGRALAEAELMPAADAPLQLRVLDARAARVTTVALKPRDPELDFS